MNSNTSYLRRIEKLERQVVKDMGVLLFVGPGETEEEVIARAAKRRGIEPEQLPIKMMWIMHVG